MAPYQYRGALNIIFQLSITIGILVANVLNYFFAKIGSWGWRLSLGGATFPAIIIIVASIVLPDTPNSLIERGMPAKALSNLRKIRGIEQVDKEFNEIMAACEASKKVQHPWKNLLHRKYRPHLTMAIAIPFFQQFTGICNDIKFIELSHIFTLIEVVQVINNILFPEYRKMAPTVDCGMYATC